MHLKSGYVYLNKDVLMCNSTDSVYGLTAVFLLEPNYC